MSYAWKSDTHIVRSSLILHSCSHIVTACLGIHFLTLVTPLLSFSYPSLIAAILPKAVQMIEDVRNWNHLETASCLPLLTGNIARTNSLLLLNSCYFHFSYIFALKAQKVLSQAESNQQQKINRISRNDLVVLQLCVLHFMFILCV